MSHINNYRPISLVSVLCKPLERHIHKHLSTYLENHQLLYPLQSGFRSKHSCHTAIARITDSWLTAINNAEVNGAVFLDLQKAFDLVDHNILLTKLKLYLGYSPESQVNILSSSLTSSSLSIPSCAAGWAQSNVPSFFSSYLSNRQQFVTVNGVSSPQGIVRKVFPRAPFLAPFFSAYLSMICLSA